MSDPTVALVPVVVFDTRIIFGATFAPAGVAAKALRYLVREEIAAVVSNRVRAEYERTITHPETLARFPRIPPHSPGVRDRGPGSDRSEGGADS